MTCKIDESQINHLQEDRVIADDKSQAEYLLNEAAVREMGWEVEEAVLQLKEGEVSDIILIEPGVMILQRLK